MIRVTFRVAGDTLRGFRITGHAGMGAAGEDIVCAAVSSAAYMTANTVTDIIGATATITVEDGLMDLTVTSRTDACQAILAGCRMHMEAMQDQYPDRVQLINTEV